MSNDLHLLHTGSKHGSAQRMNESSIPRIFNEQRRIRRVKRAHRRAGGDDNAATFVLDDIAEDIIERLSFVRLQPKNPLIVGHSNAALNGFLERNGAALCLEQLCDPAQPLPGGSYDFVAINGQLDAINDLPGALIHIRNALAPGGLAIASFVGGQSLPRLRASMLAADGDRPAARLHPMVDARAAPQLLQRAGWKDPVVDTHTLTVRYPSLDRLVHDLRDQGLTAVLADHAPNLTKQALHRAREAFQAQADEDGKTSESFDIITLTGRRSLAGT